MSRILSIQSHVLHGHVGNAAAVPSMQAFGAQVTAVPTTLLSNHPHYPTMRGRVLDAALVTGFLGSGAIGEVVAAFVTRAKQRNPRLVYVCDPVLGDDDVGAFADPALADVFRDLLLPQAQVSTPNDWEARHLVSAPADLGELDLLRALRARGLQDIVVTGGHASRQILRTLILEDGEGWLVETPRLTARPAGTGDVLTGILAAGLAAGAGLVDASVRAISATHALLERTPSAPWAEMPIETEMAAIAQAAPAFEPAPLGMLD